LRLGLAEKEAARFGRASGAEAALDGVDGLDPSKRIWSARLRGAGGSGIEIRQKQWRIFSVL